MGLWFFLTVIVVGNLAFKAYKLRLVTRQSRFDDDRINELRKEVKILREQILCEKREQRLTQLEEAVYFGDFELKRKFNQLEKEFVEEKPARL